MVSTDIRRDLVVPMHHFTGIRIAHLYQRASYADLTPHELENEDLVAYGGAWDLFWRLWRMRPDVLQGVEPFAIRLLPYLYAGMAAAVLRRIPMIVVTLENRPLADKHGPVLAALLRVMLRPVFRYAQLIVVLNDGARRNVLSVGQHEAKVRRLMYGTWGVDLTEFTPKRDGREQYLQPGPVLLFVGRLHAEKGLFFLLDAFGLVEEQFPEARLVLVGDGPERVALERLVAERGWSGRVVMTGTIKNRDLPPYFRAADVFVAPSVTTLKWEEQVGMTNIQAMACGVPVVSTWSGAIPEYVPDGVAGILVAERDPVALAKAIVRLLSDEGLRRQMGEAGRAYAIAHYDARKNVARVEDVILSLVERY
jgi:glycosyltransferase involved in cell wall biosynthesis